MIIRVTTIAEVEGVDGEEDSFKKTEGFVNTDNIEQGHRGELKKAVPIVGGENITNATFVMFKSGRMTPVVETPDELAKLANPK